MAELLSQSDPTILIAFSSLDRPSWEPVVRNLPERGYDVVACEGDKVASGETPLEIVVEPEHGLRVHYDNRELTPDSVAAAWRRRPDMFAPDQEDWAQQLRLDDERKNMQAALWTAIPEGAWLNAPERMRRAENKVGQLLAAREIGFAIPQTLITNRWDSITASLPQEIIVKMSFGVLYTKDDIRTLYTTRFANDPAHLPIEGNPFPGLWQPFVSKSREWRITAVGDETVDAAFYTSEEAKDDWCRPEYDAAVTYTSEPFPSEQKEKCLRFLDKFGLKFGAFDFIEDHNGKINFLECNTNGQFGWLEEQLDLPISAAIADELAKIALG